MANVRCPMCGKENPPDASECSYCGARLKPMRPPEDDASATDASATDAATAAGNAPDDEPEWLRALRKDQPQQAEDEESGETEISGEDSPGWLSRIRNRAQDEVDEPAEGSADESQEQVPDWLQSLGETPSPAAQPAESEDDWMRNLTGWQPEGTPGQVPTGESRPSADERLDWLSAGEQAAQEQPSDRDESFGLTGFLSSIEDQGGQPSGAGGEAEKEDRFASGELPEWLGGTQSPSAQQAASPDAPQAEFPTQPGEQDMPDWLRSLDDETSQPPASILSSAEHEERVAQDERAAQEERAGGAELFASENDLPEWLGGEAPGAPRADEPAAEAGDLPSWLGGLAEDDARQPAQEEQVAREEQAAPEPVEEVPASFAEEIGAAPQAASELAAGAAEEEELPDWLGTFGESSSDLEAASLFADEESILPESQVTQGAETGSGEEVPDWLRAFDQQPTSADAVPPLIETEPLLTSEPVFEGDQAFTMQDLPDWLSEDSAQRSTESEQPAELSGEPLAQADLPEWVKEMRPIESIIPGEAQMAETERRAEKSGPLAGVSGVLPAEELATRYSKPPIYSVKLHMTEKQRGQASQLETILAQETQPLLIRPQRKSGQSLFLRMLVALLLIVGLTLPPLMGMEPLAQPQLYPVETQQMYEQIESAAAGPVLLAVDFEPAYYGEMRLAAQPVMEHLLSKNARIVIVSTRSSGPALAQNLLAAAEAEYPRYDAAAMTENLGFLPGDTISLLEFAVQPAFAAPANLGGELAWSKSTLQGISSIRDFSSVIVLTDTAETGRAWVEQVQPQMGDVPLMMVTSAQAGPMMAPFVQSAQVNGMVSGQLGGVLYARWAKQDSPVDGYLASFQVGMLIALGLAMLGALVSGILSVVSRGQKEEE